MQGNKSNTSAVLVGIGALVLLAGFFLPWTQFNLILTNLEISGLMFANAEIYLWLLPIAALIGLGWAIYVATQGGASRNLAYIAGGAAVLALLGAIIFWVRYNQGMALTDELTNTLLGMQISDVLRLQYGFWVALVGSVVMVIGAGVAFTAEGAYPPLPTIPLPPTQYAVPMAPPAIPQTVAQPSAPTVGPSPQPQRQPTQQMGMAAAPEGWLVLRNGPRAGQQFGLTRGRRNTVGRDPSRADIIVDDNTISGEHARIQFEQGQFYLYDLASTNGTFVNNRRVQRQMLMDNDIVRLGDMQFVFKRVS